MTDEAFHSLLTTGAKIDSPRFAEQLEEFTRRCSYVSGYEGGEKAFQALRDRLEEIGKGKKEQARIFYLALPPAAFLGVSEGLRKWFYVERGRNRIVVSLSRGVLVNVVMRSGLSVENADSVGRLRSPSVMTLRAQGNCKGSLTRIGGKMRSFALITISARRL